jgi:hypothetical protein
MQAVRILPAAIGRLINETFILRLVIGFSD